MEYSDHKKPQIDINALLPDVYTSDVGSTLNDQAFNKMLTKTDTYHVAGDIGNSTATQIIEPTPHRQYNQLVPSMFSQIGSEKTTTTFKLFREQMELLGVDFSRFDKWANTTKFNWVPPINYDKLINYKNYFWTGTAENKTPQYLTIENACKQNRYIVQELINLLTGESTLLNIVSIDYDQNSFYIEGNLVSYLLPDSVIYTTSDNLSAINQAFWTVVLSHYDSNTNLTMITVIESIAHVDATSPANPETGDLWYNNTTLFQFNGVSWEDINNLQVVASVHYQSFLSIIQENVDRECGKFQGWDTRLWDDNQIGTLLWADDYLANISSPAAPSGSPSPVLYDLWNDTTNDVLKQYDGSSWVAVVQNFSAISSFASGIYTFDDVNFNKPLINQWQQENKWAPVYVIADSTSSIRAQRPILEYDRRLELAEWTKEQHIWKYRSYPGAPYTVSDTVPDRFELEPVRGYVYDAMSGLLYLYRDNSLCLTHDANYSQSFAAGKKINITNFSTTQDIYTVKSVQYRSPVVTDPAEVQAAGMITVVTLEESFVSATDSTSGDLIVPVTTSRGDNWSGYHAHWVLSNTTTEASAPVRSNLISYIESAFTPTASAIVASSNQMTPYPVLTPPSTAVGSSYVTSTFQEITALIAGATQILLDQTLVYDPTMSNYYAVDTANIAVHKNGIRLYGGYQKVTQSYSIPTYVGNSTVTVPLTCVIGITLDVALEVGDVIKIDIAPSAFSDMGLQTVPIRTVENDDDFIVAMMDGVEPHYVSLVQYDKSTQIKTDINQYPKFNVYDVITGEFIESNSVFSFLEEQTSAVDPYVQKRIVRTNNDYHFEQHLLGDNKELLAYRFPTNAFKGQFWYNPTTNKIQQWFDNSWTPSYITYDGAAASVSPIIISDRYPTVDDIVPTANTLWYIVPLNKLLQLVPPQTNVWQEFIGASAVTVGADPTLLTIWNAGFQAEENQAIPKYVNAEGQVVPVGDTTGDWAVPDQWFYNPEHENHQIVTYNELNIHANSILAAQGTYNGRNVAAFYPQDSFNYSLAGTIHDYNDSFDTLISVASSNIVSFPYVIDFAAREYNRALHSVRELFYANITTLLADNVPYVDSIITMYEENEANAYVYGDTTAFVDGLGVKNWPATSPMFGLVTPVQPYLNITNTSVELVHHDGHRSAVIIPTGSVVNYTDPVTKVVTRWSSQYTERQLQLMLANLLLEIEQRLYDVTEKLPQLLFDYGTLTVDNDETEVFNQYEQDRFSQYVKRYSVDLPYVNTNFNPLDPFTWNYYHCSDYTLTPRNDVPVITTAASWQQLYTNLYGTPYPHLEPWILQGYDNKPSWWDSEYLNETVERRWKYNHGSMIGMWENIRTGIVPAGYTLPDGTVSDGTPAVTLYNYMSVNIGDAVTIDGFAPDQILPPYYPTVDPIIRSVYDVYSQIQNKPISGDYFFGDGSPQEWAWRNSLDYNYDLMQVAFRMQPMKFVHSSFGPRFVDVGSQQASYLQIDSTSKKVYSHTDTMFHGDLYDTNKRYIAKGVNQWYCNYNRSMGYDSGIVFKEKWKNWHPRLTYQTAGIVDQETLEVSHKYFDVISEEMDVLLANTGAIADLWVDGFEVTVLNIPPSSLVQDIQSKWRFQLDTLSPEYHEISYYGVFSFPCGIDYTTNTFTAYQYDIVETSSENHMFYVLGDQTSMFIPNNQFVVSGSTFNDATYTISASSYEVATNRTRITVTQPELIVRNDVLGTITLEGYVLPWVTGSMVTVSSETIMPIPLQNNTAYFVHRVPNTNSFQLCNSPRDADAGVIIELRPSNIRNLTISQIDSSFNVFTGTTDSRTLWFHNTVDRSRVLTLSSTGIVKGMQSLINLIDGYSAFQEDKGIMYSEISQQLDPDTGRQVSWQLELERFIDWAYGIKAVMMQVSDKYQISVDVASNEMRFVSANPHWKDGTQIRISSKSAIPEPLLSDVSYYYHTINKPGKLIVQLSDYITSSTPTGLANDTTLYTVTIYVNNFTTADVAVVGQLAQTYGELVDIINAALTIHAATCTISDNTLLITSTVNELKSVVSLIDDKLFYKLPLYVSNTSLYGSADTFNLSITSDVSNPANIVKVTTEGEGVVYALVSSPMQKYPKYELNPTRDNIWISTPQGILSNVVSGPDSDYKIQQTIFDQYGRPLKYDKLTVYRQDLRSHLQIKPQIPNDVSPTYSNDPYNYIHFGGGHFFIEAYEHCILFDDYTTDGALIYDPFLGLRTPTLYLDYYESSNYTLRPNLGGYYLLDGQFNRNIEGSIEDIQNIYNTNANPQVREFVDRSRAIVGYRYGNYDYLDSIDVSKKSQFDFYRGMIKHKGSEESLIAYTNSKRVDGVEIDEYWAWKVAEYGEHRPRIYPEIILQPSDSIVDDIRLMFLTNVDSVESPDVATAISQGFEPISFTLNTNRWYQFPQQKAEIKKTTFLNAKISNQVAFFCSVTQPTYDEKYGLQYWFDKNVNQLKQWNSETSSWDVSSSQLISTDGVYVYISHEISDASRVIRYNTDIDSPDFGAHMFTIGNGIDQYTNVNAEVTRVAYSSFEGIVLVFNLMPSMETNSPLHIIDTLSNTDVKTLPIWHPAADIHYHVAEHSITMKTDTDPALYNSSPIFSAYSEKAWNGQQQGTVWLDTSALGYLPYYDAAIYPNTNDRLYNWGKQAEWSQTRVYQWVRSPVPPAEWTSQSDVQKSNSNIPQANKITGAAKQSLFSRTRTAFVCTVAGSPIKDEVDIADVPDSLLSLGSLVTFTSTDTLPPALELDKYYVVNYISVSGNITTLGVQNQDTGEIISFADGVGTLSMIPSFDSYEYVKQPNINEKHYVCFDFPGTDPVVNPTITLTNPLWIEGDTFDAYVNGKIIPANEIIQVTSPSPGVYQVDLSSLNITLYEKDILVISRIKNGLSDTDYSDVAEAPSDEMTQWTTGYEYTSVIEQSSSNNAKVSSTSYYFWVENSITNDSLIPGTMSPFEVAKSLTTMPIPYFIVMDPQDDPYYRDMYGYGIPEYGSRWSMINLNEPQYIIPIIYRQAILRKLSDTVRDDDRYIARFVSDNSKRDASTDRKNIHEEWALLRKQQDDPVDPKLWTALKEAVVGFKENTTQPVPSLDRVQYDLLNGTDTQYGLGENQAFVNKEYALATIRYWVNLYDSSFFQNHPFETSEEIGIVMDYIYDNFTTEQINEIWFSTLEDALSTKAKYKDIMKTSWISVKGTQQFNITGV